MKAFLIATITADGFIARDVGHLADWSSKEDKQLFVKLTKQAGVMVMGRNTYETIGRALPGRKTVVYTSRSLNNPEIEVTQDKPAQLLERLALEGYKEVAICGGQQIYDLFLSDGLIDEVYLTVEPLLFGNGISLAQSMLDVKLKLQETSKLNDDTLFLRYEVKK